MTRAPHVLVDGVVLSQPMGGVRRHNAELLPRVARLLEAEGGSLSVLVGRDGLPFELPKSVRCLPSSVPSGPPLRRAMQERRAIERCIAEGDFDLVHTGHFPVPPMSIPFSLTVHDLRSLELEHTPLSRRLIARSILGGALRRARAIVTVSETVRGAILERWPIEPTRVHVVPNAADHFTPLPRKVDGASPILHVGHLEPRKNIEVLLEALAIDVGLPHMVLAGAAKGDEESKLRARARELGVTDRVTFAGAFAEEELPQLYSTAAAVAFPSKLEGFGIPAIEALHAGVPLACSSAGALPEVVEGQPVVMFDPDDGEDCARALRKACEMEVPGVDLPFSWEWSAERLCRAWMASVG